MEQGFGKIIDQNKLRDERGFVRAFHPSVIEGGKNGEVGDEGIYLFDGRTIKRLVLFKKNGTKQKQATEPQKTHGIPQVLPSVKPRPPSIYSEESKNTHGIPQALPSVKPRPPSIYSVESQNSKVIPQQLPSVKPIPVPRPDLQSRPHTQPLQLLESEQFLQINQTQESSHVTNSLENKLNQLFDFPSNNLQVTNQNNEATAIKNTESGFNFQGQNHRLGRGYQNKNNNNNNINNNNNNKNINNNYNNSNNNKNINNNNNNNKNINNNNNNTNDRKRRLMYQGQVARFITAKNGKSAFGFIACADLQSPGSEGGENKAGEVFFPFENVQSNLLTLRRGDQVEFRIFINNKRKERNTKAARVKVLHLVKRPFLAVKEYLTMLKNILEPKEAFPVYSESDSGDNSLFCFSSDDDDDDDDDDLPDENKDMYSTECIKMMADSNIWLFITDQICFHDNDSLVQLLLEVILLIHESIRTLEERYRQVLVSVTSSAKFFNPIRGTLLQFIKKNNQDAVIVNLFQEFLLLVGRLVPEKRPVIVAFIKPLMENPTNETSLFLYQMLKTISKGTGENIADLDWRDLPLILKKDEIFDTELNNKINLKPVQIEGSYGSAEEYFDVYFRLLREDCFSTLRKCINQLLNGTLDVRDMNVYQKVALVGISLKDNSLYMALRIASVREVRDWETSSCLMYGNLLCISIGGGFNRPFWATVASREMLKKDNIVIVQTCWEWNEIEDSEIMLNLITAKGAVWMIESPTYYRAFRPILQTLQKLDPDSICFKEELVELTPGPMPNFLDGTCDFDSSIVFKKPVNERTTIDDFVSSNHSDNSIFDESQEDAVKSALMNRIGIIQGPPGCGKSFIGVKMLQLLLSLSSLNKPKVLVLTYKNHALDEFLKGVLRLEDVERDKVVRIGGRCKDTELDSISLASYKRSSKKTADYHGQINALYDEINDLKSEIQVQFKALNKLRTFNFDMFLESLTKEQSLSLLIDCNWDAMNVWLNFGEDVDADGFKKQKQKGRKNSKMTNKKVIEILNSDRWEKYNQSFQKLRREALKQWLPRSKQFEDYEMSLIGDKTKVVKLKIPTNQNAKKKGQKDDEEERGLYEIEDDQEIEEEQNERLSAIMKTDFTVKSDFDKTLVKVDYTEEKEGEKEFTIKPFSSNAMKKLDEMNASIVLNVNKLWEMGVEERIEFTQSIVNKETKQVRENFQRQLKEYEDQCKQKTEIENQYVASILENKQIIGATITGASINQMLLREVRPEIVIVEEAAEVLEPQLLASIGTWTKYMLLIGDHQQLRPPVESYELRKDFHFDLSMMERLINNKLPYETLKIQNRQREEFAELLFDIYPELETNHERVKNNDPATCLEKSSFFWNHAFPENKERSVTNIEEAERAVKLAFFLVQQGYNPTQITILATYRGQTALIRKTMKDYEKRFRKLVQIDSGRKISELEKTLGKSKDEKTRDTIKIHTVDMYQGDENDFVIVSLVRSNLGGKIGFLSERNRRCVAQSRARCGVYFIGNADMFLNNATWKYLIRKLKENGRVGDEIGLVCERHSDDKFPVQDANQLTLESFCTKPCMKMMSCAKHSCRKKCQPPHSHSPCNEKLAFKHLTCGHESFKKCEQDENDVKCKTIVKFNHRRCGHPGEKKCSEDVGLILCLEQVNVILKCGHASLKSCFQNTDDVKCIEECVQKRPCGHVCSGHQCFEHLKIKECNDCVKEQQAKREAELLKEKEIREENARRVQAKIEKLQEEVRMTKEIEYIDLLPEGDTHTEYVDVVDRVKKSIQPGQNWYPQITRLVKVNNRELCIKFLDLSTKLWEPEPRVSFKFYQTSKNESIDEITRNGFPKKKIRKQHGKGIFLTTDHIVEQPNEVLNDDARQTLLCEVFLGKAFISNKTDNVMPNAGTLKAQGYDCLFIPIKDEIDGGKTDGEYVVFDVCQVYPKYIIHYNVKKFNSAAIPLGIKFDSSFANSKITIKSKRGVDVTNQAEMHFAFVESRFLRMLNRMGKQGSFEITEIEIYMNPRLEEKFNRKQAEFKEKYPGMPESEAIYGFHGTKSSNNVDNIMNDNFKQSKGGKFGAGVYFSEQPLYTFGYGGQTHLIMARILPGKIRDYGSPGWDNGGCTPGYDSHGGFKQPGGTFHEIVIFDTNQILPCYVIHFKSK